MIKETQYERLDSRQVEIYNGLKDIGEAIAAFYFDGVRIYNNQTLTVKAYLLAHIAREIEGGLRNVWTKKSVEKCDKCGKPNNPPNHHIDSICEALDVGKNDPFAKRWDKIAKRFHEYAHRNKVWEEPRNQNEFDSYWKEFESILHGLLGNNFKRLDRLDRILKEETPTKAIMGILPNLLKTGSNYFYFFSHLKSPEWLKPLKDAGFFNPNKNPGPGENEETTGININRIRNELVYLVTIAKLNAENPDTNITNNLAGIVEKIVSSDIRDFYTIRDTFTIISHFPIEKINRDHIQFVRKVLTGSIFIADIVGKKLLPPLIKNNAKDLIVELLKTVLDYEETKQGNIDRFSPIISLDDFNEHIMKEKRKIAEICGIEVLDVGILKMNQLLDKDSRQFLFRRNKINYSDYTSTGYDDFLVSFVTKFLEELHPDQINSTLIKMIENEHPIFRRLAIYAINHHYNTLNELFWGIKKNLLDDYYLKPELYDLLKSNCKSFAPEQVNTVIQWIETAYYSACSDDSKNIAYKKKEWLTSLLETDNAEVKRRYEEYNIINNAVIDHPAHNFWIGVQSGEVKSPIGYREILKKDNREIVNFLNNYEGKFEPVVLSRAEELKKAVIENPLKFNQNLAPFANLDKKYLWAVLGGFWEAWEKEKKFDEGKILEFIIDLIKDENFWKDYPPPRSFENYTNWIVDAIVSFIEAGFKNSKHAFQIEWLGKIEEILLLLLNKIPTDMKNLAGIIGTLNSSKGKILSALVKYSIHFAKVNVLKDNCWKESVKKEFEKRLDGTIDHSFEYFTILGQYLHSIYRLDEKWVRENIFKIFSQRDEQDWEAAISGYFFCNNPYNSNYDMLKKSSILEKALQWDFNDEHVIDGVISHICYAYVYDNENLDEQNSLIKKILDSPDSKLLHKVIRCFVVPIEIARMNVNYRPKIRQLWEFILKSIEPKMENSEFQHAVASLWEWVYYFEEVDEQIFDWLKLSAKNFKPYSHEYEFVRFLAVYVETSPGKAGKLLVTLLEAKVSPSFMPDENQKIINFLYEREEKELADKICNLYSEFGCNEYRDLYRKYNQEV